jgi:hypothetical protein
MTARVLITRGYCIIYIPTNRRNTRGRNRKNSSQSNVTKHVDNAITNKSLHVMNVCRFPGVGFPDQLRCVLRYKENAISFTASPTPAAQVYRLNSLFDPNLTGTGHQPNYFDQLTAVYGQYCVTAARCKAQIMNEGTVEMDCVLVYSDTNLSTQTVENLSEARWSKNICLGIQSSGRSVSNLTLGTASIMNLQGERNLNTDPNNYTLTSTNPVDPVYCVFKCAASDLTTNVKAIVNFELFFDCLFKDLSLISES